jgi:hypothetical protein
MGSSQMHRGRGEGVPVHMTRDCMWQHCCLSSPATGEPGLLLNGISFVMDGNSLKLQQIILAGLNCLEKQSKRPSVMEKNAKDTSAGWRENYSKSIA